MRIAILSDSHLVSPRDPFKKIHAKGLIVPGRRTVQIDYACMKTYPDGGFIGTFSDVARARFRLS